MTANNVEDGASYRSTILNKTSIIGKSKEALCILDGTRDRPVQNSVNETLLHGDPSSVD